VATYGAECWTVKWDIDKGLANFEILKINKKNRNTGEKTELACEVL
jgi:hypothetical protein